MITAALLVTRSIGPAPPRARRRAMLLIASATAFAALGAKLYSAVERGDLVWHDLGWELQSGYRYPGAMIAGLLALPFLHRLLAPGIALPRLLDDLTLATCAGMVVVRIGCYVQGCCHGTLTTLAWATRYPRDTAPWYAHSGAGLIPTTAEWSAGGHPLQLYFLAAIAAIGIGLLIARPRLHYDGQLTLLFMLLNGLTKGALESLRFSYRTNLQFYSLAMAAIAALWLVTMHYRRPQQH